MNSTKSYKAGIENKSGGGALSGIKIMDFGWWGAGPYGTKYLADLGATVIKVESIKRLDVMRYVYPYKGDHPDLNNSGAFLQTNTSKYSFRIDLKNPSSIGVIEKMVRWADAVTENFQPGTLRRLGLGYERLKEINSDIIMVSSSCLGQKGVNAEARGNAHITEARSGYNRLTGYLNGAPVRSTPLIIGDMIIPLFAVISLLSALEYRNRTGKGQWIDLSQVETLAQMIVPAFLDSETNGRLVGPIGNRHPEAVPHGVFRCMGNDQWCAIASFSDQHWSGLLRAMHNPTWGNDPRFSSPEGRKTHEDELECLIGAWTQNLSKEEVMERLANEGVPAGAVRNAAELLLDEQLWERGCWVKITHPVMGECSHPTPPIRLSRTPVQIRTSPLFGEHTFDIATGLLGISNEEFAQLSAEGVFE